MSGTRIAGTPPVDAASARAGMPPAGLGWAAMAVAGAGVVDVGLAAGAGTGWGLVLGVVGVAQLAWGLTSLAAGRALAPRVVVPVAVGLALVWWGAVSTPGVLPATLGESGMSAADAAVVTLQLVGAGAVAVLRRPVRTSVEELGGAGTAAAEDVTARASSRRRETSRASAGRAVAGWAAGALVVAAVVTPGLAATEAGAHAVPHGSHVGAVTGPSAPADVSPELPPIEDPHSGH